MSSTPRTIVFKPLACKIIMWKTSYHWHIVGCNVMESHISFSCQSFLGPFQNFLTLCRVLQIPSQQLHNHYLDFLRRDDEDHRLRQLEMVHFENVYAHPIFNEFMCGVFVFMPTEPQVISGWVFWRHVSKIVGRPFSKMVLCTSARTRGKWIFPRQKLPITI